MCGEFVGDMIDVIGDFRMWPPVMFRLPFYFLPLPHSRKNFFLRKREVILSNRFVVAKVVHGHGEKCSPFTDLAHVIDDARDEHLVFFLGILLVENAVLLALEADASKEMRTEHTVIAENEICIVLPALIAEENIAAVEACGMCFINQLRATAPITEVHAVLGIQDRLQVFAILYKLAIE